MAGKRNGKGICQLSQQTIKKVNQGKLKRPAEFIEGQTIYECSFIDDEYASVKKPGSWFRELTKAVIQGAIKGAIEGAIIGSISEPCVPEIKHKYSQNIPGASQYGTKIRTTIKPCDYPLQQRLRY